MAALCLKHAHLQRLLLLICLAGSFRALCCIKQNVAASVRQSGFYKCRETIPQVETCLRENPRIANLWTPESHFSVRTSMYNPSARSQSVNATQPGSLLVDSVDSTQREALVNQIAELEQVCVC